MAFSVIQQGAKASSLKHLLQLTEGRDTLLPTKQCRGPGTRAYLPMLLNLELCLLSLGSGQLIYLSNQCLCMTEDNALPRVKRQLGNGYLVLESKELNKIDVARACHIISSLGQRTARGPAWLWLEP